MIPRQLPLNRDETYRSSTVSGRRDRIFDWDQPAQRSTKYPGMELHGLEHVGPRGDYLAHVTSFLSDTNTREEARSLLKNSTKDPFVRAMNGAAVSGHADFATTQDPRGTHNPLHEAFQEAYAEEVLRSTPAGFADSSTQTAGTVYKDQGKTKVTKDTVSRKPRRNPIDVWARRDAAINDLEDIKWRRRLASPDPATYRTHDYIQQFLIPRAKDIQEYFTASREGGPGTDMLDAPTAYSMGDMRRSHLDDPVTANARRRFDPRAFTHAMAIARGMEAMRVRALNDAIAAGSRVGVQTQPMRVKSASVTHAKTKPKRNARSLETYLGGEKPSMADTVFGSRYSETDGSNVSSHYSSASSGSGRQKRVTAKSKAAKKSKPRKKK